jgi:carboxyl-terminal processing protease
VVQLRDTTGRIEVDDDPDPSIFYSGPMIVLVDRFSASASEIFAGAIQDYGRGLIVGQQTYGKGTVQNAHPLNYTIFGRKPELGQLNVTIGKYYRITGESTQDRGVTPTSPCPRSSTPTKSARAPATAPCPGITSSRPRSRSKAT